MSYKNSPAKTDTHKIIFKEKDRGRTCDNDQFEINIMVNTITKVTLKIVHASQIQRYCNSNDCKFNQEAAALRL